MFYNESNSRPALNLGNWQQHYVGVEHTSSQENCIFCGRAGGHWDQAHTASRYNENTGEGFPRGIFEDYSRNFGLDSLPTVVLRPGIVDERSGRKQFSSSLPYNGLEMMVAQHNRRCSNGCKSDCPLDRMFRLAEDNLRRYSVDQMQEMGTREIMPVRIYHDHLLESLADRNSSHQNLHLKSPSPYLFITNNGSPTAGPPGLTPMEATRRMENGGCIICGETIHPGTLSVSWARVTRSPETILPDHNPKLKMRQLNWFSSQDNLGLSDEDYEKFNSRYLQYQLDAAKKWRYNPAPLIRINKQNDEANTSLVIQRDTDRLPSNGGVGGFLVDSEDRFIGPARFPAHASRCFPLWYLHCPGVQNKPHTDFEWGTGGGKFFIPLGRGIGKTVTDQ